MGTAIFSAAAAYLVSRGGGPEQEVLRELAAINGRSARQELRSKQEREHDHHARPHLLPAPGRYSTHSLLSLPASGPAYAETTGLSVETTTEFDGDNKSWPEQLQQLLYLTI